MIRFLFRWLFRALVLAIVLATALLLLRDTLAREWLTYRLRALTGLETRLQRVEAAPFNGTLTVAGLQLYNAPEFGGGPLLSVPDLHLELDWNAVWRREYRLRLARIHLAQLDVVRNAQGQTNVLVLLETVKQRATAVDALFLSPPGLRFAGVETMNLTVGTLRLSQLGRPEPPREIRVGVTNEVVSNVRGAADLSPLVVRVLLRELAEGFRPTTPSPRDRPR